MAVPELSGPAELYYNECESKKYTQNTRITKIQREMTLRAIELLRAQSPHTPILDLGCGSGLSGQTISERGYSWIGVDIAPAMLEIACRATAAVGLLRCDLGAPLPFRRESFEYALSISAVQWLFQSYQSGHHPLQRIRTFFRSLYDVVSVRAVIQFYCGKKEMDILRKEARAAGFAGGLVIDNEGTKNCKYFLVLDKHKQHAAASRAPQPRPARRRAKVE